VWQRIFTELAGDADFEEVFIDSTVIRAHRHAAGAGKEEGAQAIGRSLSWRADHQDPCLGRRPRQPRALTLDTGTGGACLRSRTTACRHWRPSGCCPQSVRLRRLDRHHHSQRRAGGYSLTRQSERAPQFWSAHRQASQPCRALLSSHQTLPSDRNPLRGTRQTLRSIHRHHRRVDLARLMSSRPRVNKGGR
jgi:hypothetical protein